MTEVRKWDERNRAILIETDKVELWLSTYTGNDRIRLRIRRNNEVLHSMRMSREEAIALRDTLDACIWETVRDEEFPPSGMPEHLAELEGKDDDAETQ